MKAINSIGDFVLVVGKVLVTSFTTLAGFYWFKSQPENGNFFVIPVFFTGVFSYFVSHSFMSIYESAVDTLLLCYCADASVVDTSSADGIIDDAVDALDVIDEEKKKKADERKENRKQEKRKGDDFLSRVRVGRKNGGGEEQGFQVVAEQEMIKSPTA